jgi:hypothetical protein
MNLLAAIGLDFLVTPQNETSAILTEGSSLFIPIVTPELGSGPLMYRVTSQQTGGSPAFCNALTLNATTSPFIYSGTLSGLTTTSTTTTGVWTIAIGLPSASGLTDGDVCLIDLVYRGWHKDAPENTGYTDEERVSFSFTLSNPVLSPLIVLPEVPLTPQIEEPTNAGSTDEAAPPPLEEPPASEIQPPQEENVQPPPEI